MANSSKKKSGLQRGESKAAFLFCTPAVVLALVFIILPFAMSVVYSFTNKQLIPKVGMETAFVGLKNYIEIFTSKVTVLSFKNTFLYALIVVPSVLVIGTVLAVFVNQKIKGVQVFRFWVCCTLHLRNGFRISIWHFRVWQLCISGRILVCRC